MIFIMTAQVFFDVFSEKDPHVNAVKYWTMNSSTFTLFRAFVFSSFSSLISTYKNFL